MKSIKRNFIFNTILSVSQVLFPLLIFPYISRVLGPSGVGQVTFIENICRYAILLAALGIPIYGVREIARMRDDKDKITKFVSEILLIHFFSTLMILIIYLFFIYNFSILKKDLIFYLFGVIFIVTNIFNVEWFFQGLEEFKFIAIRSILVKLLVIIFTFILIKKSKDELLYFFTIVLTLFLNAIVNFFYLLKRTTISYVKLKNLKRHIKPLFYIFSSTAFVSIYTLSDTILLGTLSNEHSVGLYAIGQKLARVPILFIGSLSLVLIPKLSTYFIKDDHKNFNKILVQSYEFVVFFSIPIIFFLIGNAKLIIVAFAGIEFIRSAEILIILSFLPLLVGLSNLFGLQILTPSGRDKYFTISVFLGMISSIILNYFFIPYLGAKGAAISSVISEIFVTISTYYYANKLIAVSLNLLLILKISIFSVPIFLFSILLSWINVNLFFAVFLNLLLSFVYTFLLHCYILRTPLLINLKDRIFQLI